MQWIRSGIEILRSRRSILLGKKQKGKQESIDIPVSMKKIKGKDT